MLEDKQIIIDGVNVRGCKYLNTQNPKLYWSNCGHICKDTECKYKRLWWKKQYTRKEQECEELKAKFELFKTSNQTTIDQLKAELEDFQGNCKGCSTCNEALYNGNLYAKEYRKLKAENERLQEEREKAKNYNLEYGQLLIKATNKNNKLSKTLAEIKEIITTALEQNTLINLDKILQKINEVEDVENN